MLGTNLHLGDFRLGFLKRWRGNRLGQISPLMFGLFGDFGWILSHQESSLRTTLSPVLLSGTAYA